MLKASADIDTRSVLRRRFAGSDGPIEREQNARNMLVCDSTLVTRGRGNFPFRLYEAMSAGAIPVLGDTDCRQLFDNAIPYRQQFAWFPASEVSRRSDYIRQMQMWHSDCSLFEHRCWLRQVLDDVLSTVAFHCWVSGRLARRI
jgi:hypothetical protein